MGEMEENNDTWSLLAVVRECTRKVRDRAPTPLDSITLPHTLTPEPAFETHPDSAFIVNNPGFDHSLGPFLAYNNTGSFDELVDFYKPFLVQSPPTYVTPDSLGSLPKADTGSDSGGVPTIEPHQNSHQQHQLQEADAAGVATFQPHDDQQQMLLQQRSFQSRRPMPGSCPVGIHKKKKFEERIVCRMRLDELSEDKWAWRKYGQKPIKGSPYPRNYYRCSSSKGCTARKQVERSPVDPNTYLVTYTGNHYHARPPLRNSARVNRQPDPTSSPEGESEPPSNPAAPAPDQNGSGDPVGKNGNEDQEEEGDDDEVDLIPNSMADPELLMGMERLMKDHQRSGGERKSGGSSRSSSVGNGYKEDEMMMMMKEIGSDPDVNLGLVVRGNGLCLGIQQRELDSSSPTTLAAAHESPSGRGRNIWDNGIISPQTFLF